MARKPPPMEDRIPVKPHSRSRPKRPPPPPPPAPSMLAPAPGEDNSNFGGDQDMGTT